MHYYKNCIFLLFITLITCIHPLSADVEHYGGKFTLAFAPKSERSEVLEKYNHSKVGADAAPTVDLADIASKSYFNPTCMPESDSESCSPFCKGRHCRILVVAPHPDDEAIALGGFIADRVAMGDEVWAVVLTDGEDFPRAVRANRLAWGPFIRPTQFLKLGKMRRREAKLALDELGIPPQRRFFLGYPTKRLWRLAISPRRPNEIIRSSATKQRFGIAEWQGVRRKPHPFSREMLEADLDAILNSSRPDIILVPHPRDSNADHRAAALLIGKACLRAHWKGELRGYIVHQGSRRQYPRQLGFLPDRQLMVPHAFPPPILYEPSQNAIKIKEKALRCHRSQIRLKDNFLLSFVRRYEHWWPLSVNDLVRIQRVPIEVMEKHTTEEIIERQTTSTKSTREKRSPLSANSSGRSSF